jgi:alpha-ribazole phosphatase
MTHLILIRHGETEWTSLKRYQGHSDTLLTTRGRKQMKAVARALKDLKIDFLYASPLKRAHESAQIIAHAIGKKPRPDSRLREIHFGLWEGRTAEELYREREPTFMQWSKGKLVSPKGGENISVFRKRVRSFLKDCLKRHSEKTVAVVAHGGPIKMLIFEALKLSSHSLWSLRVEPGAISALSFCPHFSQLVCLNLVTPLTRAMPWLVKK